jgi:hypothetical protein
LVIADNSLSPKKMKYFGLGLVAIENQTTNIPPASPADGVAYLVGPAPTGLWALHVGEIAIYETTTWQFYAPYVGLDIFDRSQSIAYRFDGTAWGASVSGYSKTAISAGVATVSPVGTYVYSATAPTTANMGLIESVSYTPKRVGALIEVTFICAQCNATVVNTSAGASFAISAQFSFGLFLDSVASAVDWSSGPSYAVFFASGTSVGGAGGILNSAITQTFTYVATDTNSHVFKIYGAGIASAKRTKIIIREGA